MSFVPFLARAHFPNVLGRQFAGEKRDTTRKGATGHPVSPFPRCQTLGGMWPTPPDACTSNRPESHGASTPPAPLTRTLQCPGQPHETPRKDKNAPEFQDRDSRALYPAWGPSGEGTRHRRRMHTQGASLAVGPGLPTARSSPCTQARTCFESGEWGPPLASVHRAGHALAAPTSPGRRAKLRGVS